MARPTLAPARRRARRALLAAAAMIAPYVVYLVVGNLALWSGLVSRIASQSPSTAQISYGSTFTWWPGRLHARDVRIAFQSEDFQLEIAIDEVTTDVSLFALTDKRFVADDVEARGVSFRLRLKRAAEDLQSVEALPPIPAFGPLPLRGPPDTGPPDPKPWQVHLTRVRAQVKETWIELVRFEGDATVAADFSIVPGQHLRLARTRGEVRSGHVESAGETVFAETALRFRAAIPWFDIAANPTEEILAALVVVAEGTSTVDEGAAARRLRIAPPEVDASGGGGRVWVRAALSDERVIEGSVARYAGSSVGASVGGASLQSLGHGDATLVATDTGLVGEARLVAVEVASAQNPTLRARLEKAQGSLVLATPTLRKTTFEGAQVELPSGAINLGAWRGQGLGPVTIGRGTVFGRATLRIDRDGVGSGGAHFEAYDADVRAGPMRLIGRCSADVTLTAWRIADGTVDFGPSSLTLREVDVRVGQERVTSWWGRFDLSDAGIRPGEHGAVFRSTVSARARDATPVTALLEGEDLVPGIAADMLEMPDLTVRGRITIDADAFDGRLVRTAGGSASVAGRFAVAGGAKRGAAVVRVGPVSAGVGFGEEDAWIRVLAGDGWLDEQSAKLDAWLTNARTSRRRVGGTSAR